MVELKTIEQLLYFIKGNISLSRYDSRFVDNLTALQSVTTNQVQLFDKILHKYRRQLAKHELSVEKLSELPWNVKIIESVPEFTDGYVYIEDNKINFRCPFNRNFINKFRSTDSNNFLWNREKKVYEVEYGPHNLKLLFNVTKDFFPELKYCDTVKNLLEPLLEYSNVKHWNPTLVKVNGNLLISAINPYLDDALGDLELNTNPTTLSTLSLHGVDIDPSVEDVHADPQLLFSAEYNPIIELADIKKIIPWLKELGCDLILLSGGTLSTYNKNGSDIVSLCKQHGIFAHEMTAYRSLRTEQIKQHKYIVSMRTRNTDSRDYDSIISKSIRIVNSEPITIK